MRCRNHQVNVSIYKSWGSRRRRTNVYRAACAHGRSCLFLVRSNSDLNTSQRHQVCHRCLHARDVEPLSHGARGAEVLVCALFSLWPHIGEPSQQREVFCGSVVLQPRDSCGSRIRDGTHETMG